MKLTLPIPPTVNHYWRMVGRRIILSKAGRLYKERTHYLALAQGARPIHAPQEVQITIVWYRESKRGDLDNRLKPLLDALQGAAYQNDSQVARIEMVRDDSCPKEGRMDVTITALEAQ